MWIHPFYFKHSEINMRVLDGIRATGTQKLRTAADNGDSIEMTLYYMPATQGWRMDITSGDFTIKGQRLYNLPNILFQYQNIIPFGIGVFATDLGSDPFLVNDFSTGRIRIGILTPAEVEEVSDFYKESA